MRFTPSQDKKGHWNCSTYGQRERALWAGWAALAPCYVLYAFLFVNGRSLNHSSYTSHCPPDYPKVLLLALLMLLHVGWRKRKAGCSWGMLLFSNCYYSSWVCCGWRILTFHRLKDVLAGLSLIVWQLVYCVETLAYWYCWWHSIRTYLVLIELLRFLLVLFGPLIWCFEFCVYCIQLEFLLELLLGHGKRSLGIAQEHLSEAKAWLVSNLKPIIT